MFSSTTLEEAVRALGDVLADRGVQLEIVAIGGGSLLLLGLIERPTKDLDVLAIVENHLYLKARPLPALLTQAAADVARLYNLEPDWINPGPTDQLSAGLPEGFAARVTSHQYGGLLLHLASRFDQICLKLYAAADADPRSKHYADLSRLAPTATELADAARWVKTQDLAPEFPEFVDQVIQKLRAEHDAK